MYSRNSGLASLRQQHCGQDHKITMLLFDSAVTASQGGVAQIS